MTTNGANVTRLFRAPNSFSESELTLLGGILTALSRGGDVSTYVRKREFGTVWRKIAAMSERIDEQKGRAAR